MGIPVRENSRESIGCGSPKEDGIEGLPGNLREGGPDLLPQAQIIYSKMTGSSSWGKGLRIQSSIICFGTGSTVEE